jgi:uncharacterized membrane protein
VRSVNKLLEKADGYKTYIVAGVVAVVTFARMVGWIEVEVANIIFGFLAALGLYSVRDAVRKVEDKK